VRVAGVELVDPQPVSGGDICQAYAAESADGKRIFAKTLPSAPTGLFEAEARGLDLLRVAGGPPVPGVVAVGPDGLVLAWVAPGSPSDRAAADFGRRLAHLHRAAGERFGAESDGYVATVPLDNAPTQDWPTFFAQRRVGPALAAARRRDAIGDADAGAIQDVIGNLAALAGPGEPPARIHGDLWAGNLLWGADGQVWLIDAGAAHFGHRETDLAMLALFGVPYLDDILAGYDASFPLAAGWHDRIALHQLHPLLIHAALFGGGYGARAAAAARSLLR
jgi:fructosamine-3-kinase